jgi:hypothetical protein
VHKIGHHWPWFPVQHWVAVHLGVANENSVYYAWWSGSGSDVWGYTVAATVVLSAVHMFRRHNCKEHGCWRIGIHEYLDVDGQRHIACKHHHPVFKDQGHFHFHELHARKMAQGRSVTWSAPGPTTPIDPSIGSGQVKI